MKGISPIIRSVVTEKSSVKQEGKQYTFLVKRDATKIDIKKAVKEIYGVDAEQVRTMISPKKVRILKGKYEWAKRPVSKKAIVTLKGKASIDPNKIKDSKPKTKK